MAEPPPDPVPEAVDNDEETPVLPKSAEDRIAAAALHSVAARDDDSSQESAAEIDQEALGRAMKNLDVAGGGGAREQDAGDRKKAVNVKVDPADVALLVEELDLPKGKATELLKNNDGDAVQAMKSFVTASA